MHGCGVLKSVIALDFQPLGLSKEVLLADGGSTDRTVELARTLRNVRIYELPKVLGRGAALRMGIEKARGNLIVFFPGDNEYRPEDLYAVVESLMRQSVRAVFGTRAVKCTDLSERLKQIYHNNLRLYLTSKYGGILLSVLTLVLFNRYVTDVLSSVKAFDARLLKSLQLKSDGIDLETEIVAKLSRRKEYMFELPVDYRPRPREAERRLRGWTASKRSSRCSTTGSPTEPSARRVVLFPVPCQAPSHGSLSPARRPAVWSSPASQRASSHRGVPIRAAPFDRPAPAGCAPTS